MVCEAVLPLASPAMSRCTVVNTSILLFCSMQMSIAAMTTDVIQRSTQTPVASCNEVTLSVIWSLNWFVALQLSCSEQDSSPNKTTTASYLNPDTCTHL